MVSSNFLLQEQTLLYKLSWKGIVPTLTIIRIGLVGRTRDATSLHNAEVMQSSTPILDSIFSTVGTTAIAELTPRFDDNAQVSSYVENNSATYNCTNC